MIVLKFNQAVPSAGVHLEPGGLPNGDVTVDILREVALLLHPVPQQACGAGPWVGVTVGAVVVAGGQYYICITIVSQSQLTWHSCQGRASVRRQDT